MASPGVGMSRFAHWIVDCSVKHNAAILAAKALDPANTTPGRVTPAETEISRLSIAMYEKLHTLENIVRKYGIEGTFGAPPRPLSPEERKELRDD